MKTDHKTQLHRWVSSKIPIRIKILCLIWLLSSILLLPPTIAEIATVHFIDQTEASGITFRHINGVSKQKYIPETMGAGCLFFDYNNDNLLDIYLVNSGRSCENIDLPRQEPDEINALYRNNGDGTFTDVTVAAGLDKNVGYGMGCISADYDNDGDSDLYLTNYGENQFYRNNGDGTFTDITQTAGVADPNWSVSASFGDYNLDGFLDLYVANYLNYKIETAHPCSLEGVHIYCGPHEFPGISDTLYRNNGDGTFTDVTTKAGVRNSGKGLGVIFTDYNDDGYPDILVANDAVADFLYRNNRDGSFTDMAIAAGIAFNSEGRETASMGIADGDYDNDQRTDFLITNFSLEVNSLFRNEGDGNFTMTTYETGIAEPSFNRLGFGAQFLDADNDGYLDLFVANGHVWDNVSQITPTLSYRQKSQFFYNTGTGRLTDSSDTAGEYFKNAIVARGTAIGDYDNDGDADILVTTSNNRPFLLQNNSNTHNNWLRIKLIGTSTNRDAIGAKITVKTENLTQFKEVSCGGSYASCSSGVLLFGLGKNSIVKSLEVKWLDGKGTELCQTIENIATNQTIIIEETR